MPERSVDHGRPGMSGYLSLRCHHRMPGCDDAACVCTCHELGCDDPMGVETPTSEAVPDGLLMIGQFGHADPVRVLPDGSAAPLRAVVRASHDLVATLLGVPVPDKVGAAVSGLSDALTALAKVGGACHDRTAAPAG